MESCIVCNLNFRSSREHSLWGVGREDGGGFFFLENANASRCQDALAKSELELWTVLRLVSCFMILRPPSSVTWNVNFCGKEQLY